MGQCGGGIDVAITHHLPPGAGIKPQCRVPGPRPDDVSATPLGLLDSGAQQPHPEAGSLEVSGHCHLAELDPTAARCARVVTADPRRGGQDLARGPVENPEMPSGGFCILAERHHIRWRADPQHRTAQGVGLRYLDL